MRVINFLLFLSFFLLGGRIHSYAITSNHHHSIISSQKISKSRHVKITNESNNFLIIEDSDIDLEEEYFKIHDLKKQSENNFSNKNFNPANSRYTLFFNRRKINCNLKFFKSNSFLYNLSTPIYIFQGVLRI